MFIDAHVGALCEPVSGRSWDRDGARIRVHQRASTLERIGVKRGDRVFLHYGNRAEFFFDIAALWTLGACAVPVDPRFTAYEIEQLARAVRPAFAVWNAEPDASFRTALAAVDARLLDTSFDAAGGSPLRTGLPHLDDPALVLFTSGTTGQPKAVVHTHRSLRARWNSQRDRLGVAAYARTLCVLPTNFAWGLVGNSLYPWLSGQDLFITPAFRSDVLMQLGRLCDEHAITYLPAVPAMWRLALKTVAPPKQRTLLRVSSGTSPLPAALWLDIGRWSGAPEVMNVYGITETGWLAGASTPAVSPEDGLIGAPWGAVIKVLEHDDANDDPLAAAECAPGESGQVWAQAASLMHGYFERDDFSRQVLVRGWFATGDVGYVDERGLLYLRGREKEIINVGGVKVYPADIDAVLLGCGGVLDACTFPIDDALQGDVVGVAIVIEDRSEAQIERVYGWAAARVARHQMPRRWYLVEEIPRTPRGKVNRARVAAACANLRALDLRSLERATRAFAASNP